MRTFLEKYLKTNSKAAALNFNSSLSKKPPLFNLSYSKGNTKGLQRADALSKNTKSISPYYNRFNPFTSLPNNLAENGFNQDELKISMGQQGANPLISPMKSTSDSGKKDKREEITELREIIQTNEFPTNFTYTNINGMSETVALNNLNDAKNLLQQLVVRLRMEESMRRVNSLRSYSSNLNQLRNLVYYNTLLNSKEGSMRVTVGEGGQSYDDIKLNKYEIEDSLEEEYAIALKESN